MCLDSSKGSNINNINNSSSCGSGSGGSGNNNGNNTAIDPVKQMTLTINEIGGTR